MNIIEILDEMFRVYWNTCIEYLKRKQNDREWIHKNFQWLNKIVDKGMETVKNIESGKRYFPLYQVMEENTELREVLYKACNNVIDKYEKVYNKVA